jgi:hypothetical protein
MKWILLAFSISTLHLFGQPICDGYQLAYQAEHLYRANQELDKAVYLYGRAFRKNLKGGSIVLDAITCATSINDRAASIRFLKYGLSKGFKVSDYKRLWMHLGNGRDFESLIGAIDTLKIRMKYKSTLDHELIGRIKLLSERDQYYRSEDEYNGELQSAYDSLNWKELKAITASLGHLPGHSELGLEGSDDLDLIFYHMDKNEIEWFLPYIITAVHNGESNLGHTILYQLERIGMEDGIVYTITDDYKIEKYADKTRMKNGLWCQTYGEWFSEPHPDEKAYYFTPLDPQIPIEEINNVRHLFCLDNIESKWKRTPWVKVISIYEFEEKFRNIQ